MPVRKKKDMKHVILSDFLKIRGKETLLNLTLNTQSALQGFHEASFSF